MEHRSIARYGAVAQALHWATALIVLIAFIYGPGGSEERVYAFARDFDRQLHETLGLCALALVVMRTLWRPFDTRPDPPQMTRWTAIAAKAVQGGLYLLLFAVPFTAIVGAWLEGIHLRYSRAWRLRPSWAFHMMPAQLLRASTLG